MAAWRRDSVTTIGWVAAMVGAAVALWVDAGNHDVVAGGSTPPAAAPAHPPMRRANPVRLRIPTIGVDAPVGALGLKRSGHLESPPLTQPQLTGWYRGGPSPGERGPAVVVGHRDAKSPAVFFHLPRLSIGETVEVTRTDGSVAVFSVRGIDQYPRTKFPTEKVYGDLDHSALRLITCGGTFDHKSGQYTDNIVVSADLTATKPKS